jgi:hypothetical protein
VTADQTPAGLGARRWVTPGGARIDLAHLTHTSANGGRRGLRDGGAYDGYCLTATHPSGCVLSTTYLGRTVPEAELDAALAAIDAHEVTGLPTPTTTTAKD